MHTDSVVCIMVAHLNSLSFVRNPWFRNVCKFSVRLSKLIHSVQMYCRMIVSASMHLCVCVCVCVTMKRKCRTNARQATTLDKKRTILEIRGEKNAVPRVISCSITSDQARARSNPRLSATFALRWSRVIEHDITRGTVFFSPRISKMVLFLARVVYCSSNNRLNTRFIVSGWWDTSGN